MFFKSYLPVFTSSVHEPMKVVDFAHFGISLFVVLMHLEPLNDPFEQFEIFRRRSSEFQSHFVGLKPQERVNDASGAGVVVV